MPLTPQQLAAEKLKFLAKFQLPAPLSPRWSDVAYGDAVTAASRRAHLYRPYQHRSVYLRVRKGWQAQLNVFITRYGAMPPTMRQLWKDILELQAVMNAQFGPYFFTASNDGIPPGFRIAHAQKSLSLLLKHFWCNGLIGEPPCCPVDRWVLTCSGYRHPGWIHIDNRRQYFQRLRSLQNAASGAALSMAEWELKVFN